MSKNEQIKDFCNDQLSAVSSNLEQVKCLTDAMIIYIENTSPYNKTTYVAVCGLLSMIKNTEQLLDNAIDDLWKIADNK